VSELTSTKTGITLLETELNCRECSAIVVDIYEVHGITDGRGYICCYECGDPAEVEIE
jgi:transcription elongation factor Elf1